MTCIGRSRSVGESRGTPFVVLTTRRIRGPPQLRRSTFLRWTSMVTGPEEVPMSIVGGLGIHRKQLTFDWVALLRCEISGRAELCRRMSDRLGEFRERRIDPQCGA